MPSIHTNRGIGRARKARAAFGLPPDEPLGDVVAVAEQRAGVHVVVLDLDEGVAGAYVRRADHALLFVNGRQAPARQRFTVAHELGHHRLGHATVVDRLAALTDGGHDPQEVEANAFAAEFLVPRAALERLIPNRRAAQISLEQVVRIACAFGVSAQMACIRLKTFGALSDPERYARLSAEIHEELHLELVERLGLEEPDDAIAAAAQHLPRVPESLRRSAFGQFLAGELDADQLARRLVRPRDAVDRMLANLGLDGIAVPG